MSADLEKSKLWQQARALVKTVDTLCKLIPAHEQFTFTNQMHGVAVSLTADIAMIVGKGDKDSLFDYRYARGHLLSIKSFVLIAQDYGYLEDTSAVLIDIETIKRQLDDKIDEIQDAEDSKKEEA